MKKFIKGILILNFIFLLGCGGGSSSSSDSKETKLLRSLIEGKTLHEYDGYTYSMYEFKSDNDVLYHTYFDGSTTSNYGNTSYSITNGTFTLEWPTYTDVCTLESNTSRQINMKCKNAKNLILWRSKREAKDNPFNRD